MSWQAAGRLSTRSAHRASTRGIARFHYFYLQFFYLQAG